MDSGEDKRGKRVEYDRSVLYTCMKLAKNYFQQRNFEKKKHT